jgi:hypothetical protein
VKYLSNILRNSAKFTFLLLFLLACSPERDNPYDPKSDFYTNKTKISGTCHSRAFIPIENVLITLSPKADTTFALQTFSKADGKYELFDCPAESVLIVAQKAGFVAESTETTLFVYRSETLNFKLEALPKFLSTEVTSYFQPRNPPDSDLVGLSLKCEVRDDDGQSDIGSIFAKIEGLPDSIPLFFKINYLYENDYEEDSLSNKLDNIIGRDIYFTVQDQFSNTVKSSPLRLIRVIKNPPDSLTPAEGVRVSPHPVLTWRAPNYLFSHSFFCDIYYLPHLLPPVLYHHYENIAASDSSFQVPDSLIEGNHYWQIGVMDSYGNWAKSAEGVFEVQ